jgi:hypothetical protein
VHGLAPASRRMALLLVGSSLIIEVTLPSRLDLMMLKGAATYDSRDTCTDHQIGVGGLKTYTKVW